MADLAVIILTRNEERHIERALGNVADVAREIFVVDSYSTDRTVALAQENPRATVLQHEFINHSDQFQWALDTIKTDCAWIMRLDADEMLDAALLDEIETKLPTLPSEVVGVALKRKHIFMGRWIRYGGRYPIVLLRIWRRGTGRIENRWMDEHIVVSGGRTITFHSDFSDVNLNDLTSFTAKHNDYATREAIERLNDEFGLFARDRAVSVGAGGRQARVKRITKLRLYNRLPFGVGPVFYFIWRYFALLGFLDGREGFIYHFLQGFWYRLLVEAKTHELRRAVSRLRHISEIKAELAQLTDLHIQ